MAIAIALAVICGAAFASAVSFIIMGVDAQDQEPGIAYIIIGVTLFLITIVGWSGCMYVMLFRPCVSVNTVAQYSLVSRDVL